MVRNERAVNKHDSDSRVFSKSKSDKKIPKEDMESILVKLAEMHGLI